MLLSLEELFLYSSTLDLYLFNLFTRSQTFILIWTFLNIMLLSLEELFLYSSTLDLYLFNLFSIKNVKFSETFHSIFQLKNKLLCYLSIYRLFIINIEQEVRVILKMFLRYRLIYL